MRILSSLVDVSPLRSLVSLDSSIYRSFGLVCFYTEDNRLMMKAAQQHGSADP